MYIERSFYLNQLIGHKNNKLIKIITGARKVGKSTLLFNLYADYLINEGVNNNQILVFKMDDQIYSEFKNPKKVLMFLLMKSKALLILKKCLIH